MSAWIPGLGLRPNREGYDYARVQRPIAAGVPANYPISPEVQYEPSALRTNSPIPGFVPEAPLERENRMRNIRDLARRSAM